MSMQNLIEKYELAVPRYTSYPTANYFKDGFPEDEYIQHIIASNQVRQNHLAFYVHIPFCAKVCYYCGCNACIARSPGEVGSYIECLLKEISLVKKHIDSNRKISQIHFGGGTPNSIDAGHIEEIMSAIGAGLSYIGNPEIAIECNPAYLGYSYLDRLLKLGFNRFSLGIQDFNNDVLKLVNRLPSAIPVAELTKYLRSASPLVSVNLDFIYGLPGQTTDGFRKTISEAIEHKPDRLVTFSYAHVPWLKKHQQILEKAGLPDSSHKVEMFLTARELLQQSGYNAIGLDHYVLPDDELYTAFNCRELHRNFQGYCTRRTTAQVYAFGVSGISQLENAYIQNTKDINNYIHAIGTGRLPVEKGIGVSADQMIIRDAINGIMCNKYLNMKEVSEKHGITLSDFYRITGFEPQKLSEPVSDGLVKTGNDTITVTEQGSLFIRNIASAFDPAFVPRVGTYSKSL